MLAGRGRLELPAPVAAWRREILATGLQELPVDGEVGIQAAQLQDFHADPADRILVATAMLRGATLVTADRKILRWSDQLSCVDARR